MKISISKKNNQMYIASLISGWFFNFLTFFGGKVQFFCQKELSFKRSLADGFRL